MCLLISLTPNNRLLHLILLVNPLIILQNLVLRVEVQLWVLRLLIWALIYGIVSPLRWLVTYIALCWPNILLNWILRIRRIWKVLGWKRLLSRIPMVVGKIGWNISIVVLVEIVVRHVIAWWSLVNLSDEWWLLVARLRELISYRLEILSSRIWMSLT